jgi:predicted TIM-barrel fold metal-dependent hydrolase
MLDFLRHGEGRCWVKLTAPYRIATEPEFNEAIPIGQALIDAAPDRIIWGSDYPYLSNAHRVESIALFNVLARCAPDASIRRKILVDNPARLFGF